MKSLSRAANIGARQAWIWRNRAPFHQPVVGHQPRLLVDVSTIIHHDAQTGIQRVVRSVWSELLQRSGMGFEVLPVFATNSHGYCYAPVDFLERKFTAVTLHPAHLGAGDKFLGLDLSAHLLPKYRRQLRSWRAHGATLHLIVYDLLPLRRPDWFTPSAVTHFRKWLTLLGQDVDEAICISTHVAHELRQTLLEHGIPRGPSIGRLQMGCDIAASVPSMGVSNDLKRFLEHLRFRPGILMVGTIEPRKGYEVALAAFDHLWRTRPTDSPDLVLVGRAGWKTQKLQERIRLHPRFGDRLHWFDEMSDEGLCLLYDGCHGLLMASRGEGWGLPLIEAAMHRRYVLARDIAVFREHKLPNVKYFNDDSAEALSAQLMKLLFMGQNAAPAAYLPTWAQSVDALLRSLGLLRVELNQIEPPLRKAS